MRDSNGCPKCKSTDVIRIPGDMRGFGSYFSNLIVVGWKGPYGSAKVTRYLCASCGFSEEWVDSADDIAKVKKAYAS